MMRVLGSIKIGARFVGGHAVNLRPDPSPCWCGVSVCYDHGRPCDRCGWNRARAMLRYVNVGGTRIMQCIDACEDRPSQWD